MKPNPIIPALVVPFIAWRIYARARNNIGRQRLQPRSLVARLIVFSLLCLFVAWVALQFPSSLVGLAGGLAVGAPLALLGLHLTRFEMTAEGKFYTPNTYIGVAVTLLLVGRLIYRAIVLMMTPTVDGAPIPSLFQSPLTFLFFGLTAGYYLAYYTGLLMQAKKADQRNLAAPPVGP